MSRSRVVLDSLGSVEKTCRGLCGLLSPSLWVYTLVSAPKPVHFGHCKPNPKSSDWAGRDVVATSGFAFAACLTWVCPRLRVVTLPYSHGWDLVDQDLISARPKRVCVHQVHEQVRPSASCEKQSLPFRHRMHRLFAVSSLKYTDAFDGLGSVQATGLSAHQRLRIAEMIRHLPYCRHTGLARSALFDAI